MNILGPEFLIFGVDDLDACAKCAEDYGLAKVESGSHGATYEAMNGTGIIFRKSSDTSLPPAFAPSPNLRETRYGVADEATLQAIAAELSKDRAVKQLPDGVLLSTDADGYNISFVVSRRRKLVGPHYGVNVPWQAPGRPLNATAVKQDAIHKPCSLSHVVMFTKDAAASEAFYERLGFRTTDRFIGVGPFMRPAGTNEHHTLFMIQAPVKGIEHFTFHFAGAGEMLKAGWDFSTKGYKSFWGPGRHIMGSNYFWYFRSPFGGNMEFDADMDVHDDNWTPRALPLAKDNSQYFLLQYAEKWMPGAGPH